LESTDLRGVCEIFLRYIREIHRKSTPKDPNFLAISASLGKIEQFIESVFPSSTTPSLQQLRLQAERAERIAKEPQMTAEEKKELYWIYAAIAGMWIILFVIMSFIAWMAGARFDVIFGDIRKGVESVFGWGGVMKEVVEGAPGRGEL
jgi:farnesyl-diphosphate farnesyltransferase